MCPVVFFVPFSRTGARSVAKGNEITSRQPGWHIVKTCLILSDGGLKRAARKCKE